MMISWSGAKTVCHRGKIWEEGANAREKEKETRAIATAMQRCARGCFSLRCPRRRPAGLGVS